MRQITIKSVIILVAISFMCIGLTSCSKRVGGLSGYYSTSEESTYYHLSATKKVPVSLRREVLYFYNSNTVIKYFTVCNRKVGDYSKELVSGWYYADNDKTYTYTMVDNKVVLTNGEIFTVGEGGEFLIKDGDSISNQLKKWNPQP